MKFIITILLTSSFLIAHSNDIDQINSIKKKAEIAFSKKDFSKAALNYELLIDSFQVNTTSVLLNLAHSYYGIDSLQKAKNIYTNISSSETKHPASIAFQQLGKITVSESKIQLSKNNYDNTSPEQISALKTALTYFKNSLKNNPSNSDSRYNYEAIAKWLNNMPEEKKDDQEKHEKEQEKKKEEQKKEEDQQKKDSDQKNKDSKGDKEDKDSENKKDEGKDGEKKKDKDKGEKSNQEKKGEKSEDGKEDGKEGKKDKEEKQGKKKGEEQKNSDEEQKKEEQGKPSKEEQKKQEAKQREAQVQQRLGEHNLSKEKALQLLNTIDQQEKKYLQQQERKSQTSGNESDKPDW